MKFLKQLLITLVTLLMPALFNVNKALGSLVADLPGRTGPGRDQNMITKGESFRCDISNETKSAGKKITDTGTNNEKVTTANLESKILNKSYSDKSGHIQVEYFREGNRNIPDRTSIRFSGDSNPITFRGTSCFSTLTWGVGVRLGDPSGLTVKKYLPGSAFELSIGRTYVFSGAQYYNDQFYNWYYDRNFEYADFQYLGYRAYSPVGIQFHYLFRYAIDRIGDERIAGLEAYWGIGGQFRFQNYRYDYRYRPAGSNDWFYANGRKVTDIDFGVDGVAGLEYKFRDVPVSVFIDGTLFMEVVDDPIHFWLQGAVGARYLF